MPDPAGGRAGGRRIHLGVGRRTAGVAYARRRRREERRGRNDWEEEKRRGEKKKREREERKRGKFKMYKRKKR